MGKGTNYEKKPTLLDGLVLAGRLLKHTRDIIRNENVFDPQRDFQNRLLVKIYDTALDVNSKAYVANELRVGDNPRIVKAKDGALFLGFVYRLTDSGKVLMLRDPQRVKETRRKYRRLAKRIARGELAPEKLDASYQGVRACMEKGTNRRLVRRMDMFVEELKRTFDNRKETVA